MNVGRPLAVLLGLLLFLTAGCTQRSSDSAESADASPVVGEEEEGLQNNSERNENVTAPTNGSLPAADEPETNSTEIWNDTRSGELTLMNFFIPFRCGQTLQSCRSAGVQEGLDYAVLAFPNLPAEGGNLTFVLDWSRENFNAAIFEMRIFDGEGNRLDFRFKGGGTVPPLVAETTSKEMAGLGDYQAFVYLWQGMPASFALYGSIIDAGAL